MMLNNIFGTPVPPSAAVARLRAVDPRLNLRWVSSMAGGYWAFTREWDEHDPRRAAIQQGQMSEKDANDIVATLPGDCSPDEAGAFVERYFKPSEDPRKDAIKAVEEAVRAEQATKAAQLEQFIADQTEKAIRTTDHERRLMAGQDTAHPMVPGVGAGEKPRGSGKKGRSSDTMDPAPKE